MQQYAKLFSLMVLLLGCSFLLSGCLQTKITTGAPPSSQTAELVWAHGFVYGLVPPVNGPLDVGSQCNDGISEIYFRQSFVQVLAQGLTSSLYTPQRFTVTCAAGAMSSAEGPPSTLLRNAPSSPRETLAAQEQPLK